MSTGVTIMIVAVALVIAATAMAGGVEYGKRKLRSSFGPEYHRVSRELGSRRSADRELQRRTRTHAELAVQPISTDDQEYYATCWEHVQGGFLDDPVVALGGAEQLVVKVLHARATPAQTRTSSSPCYRSTTRTRCPATARPSGSAGTHGRTPPPPRPRRCVQP